MGFLDKVLGRTPAVKPNLDQLFKLSDAAITLQLESGFLPTGYASVAFRATEGGAFASLETELQQLLDADDGPDVERSKDAFGYTWLLVKHDPSDLASLVTDLHAVNTSLEEQGFGPMLLCSLMSFVNGSGQKLALVYLYKRGAFYPFAPTGAQQRDSALELQIRGTVANDLRVEPDLSRWFPVWGAPGL